MTATTRAAFERTTRELRRDPAKARSTFAVVSRQVEGLKSEAHIRQFTVPVDEPEVLGGSDSAPNPVEYVLAALAACQEVTYRLFADQRGIPLNAVSVNLKGDLDLRGLFALDANVRPGFTGIRGTVHLDSPASLEELAALKRAVDAHCPVLDILRAPVPVSLELAARARTADAA